MMRLSPSILRAAAVLVLTVLAACSRPAEKEAAPATPTPLPAAHATPISVPRLIKPTPSTPPQTPTPAVKKELGEALKFPEPSH